MFCLLTSSLSPCVLPKNLGSYTGLLRPTISHRFARLMDRKESLSTVNCPVSWYSRATRAVSFLAFYSLQLPKTPGAPSVRAFFQASIWPKWTSYRVASWATVFWPFTASSTTAAHHGQKGQLALIMTMPSYGLVPPSPLGPS